MKRIAILMVATLALSITTAYAATAQQQKMKTCNAEATEKKLKGEDRKAFMSNCLSSKPSGAVLTPQQEKMKSCNVDATSQNLKGAARKKFMSECLAKEPVKPAEPAAPAVPAPVPTPGTTPIEPNR